MNLYHLELEKLLDEIHVVLTYTDRYGTILYRNRAAAERPSLRARDIGVNIKNCHALPESITKIEKIFNDFIKGRRMPHCYVSQRLGRPELVTLVPIFKEDNFAGCLSVIHVLERKGVG